MAVIGKQKNEMAAAHLTESYCLSSLCLHCVSKNDTDVAHYNFNAHQRILVFFRRHLTVSLLEIAVKDRIARQSDTIQITKSDYKI